MKRTIVISIVIAVVAVGTLTLGVLVIARSYGPAVKQPLAFNHKKHLEKESRVLRLPRYRREIGRCGKAETRDVHALS